MMPFLNLFRPAELTLYQKSRSADGRINHHREAEAYMRWIV